MPAETPTPITPEGKRAADRIRSIFFMIAAANIVLVAIVLWQRQAHKERPDATPKPAAEETSANRPAKDEDRNPAAPVK
jgi:hypothetical protein